MFCSVGHRIGPLILILFGLTFPIQCPEYELYDEKCYTVGNRDVCFFRPYFNYTLATWYKGRATCGRRNGTLPFIQDKAIQGVFEEYMNSLKLNNSEDMWLAGREMRRNDWTWVNGLTFNESYFTQNTYSESDTNHLQAILADEGVYRKEFLGNRNNYVCQFFGEGCKSRDAISLKHGCVMLNDGVAFDAYDARNKCVERGVDLAVIDGQDDMNKFQQVFSRIGKYVKIWVGLRRQWWMWNATDAEIKYSNWLPGNGFQPDNRQCMVTELQDYLWKQDNCLALQRFICQRGPTIVEVPAMPTQIDPTMPTQLSGQSSFVVFLVAGASILVVTIVLVVVIAAVIVKKRTSRLRKTRKEVVPRETSYQYLDDSVHQTNNSINNQQYTELQPPTKKPLLPARDRPMKSEQTEENIDYYEEIGEIGGPDYTEVIH